MARKQPPTALLIGDSEHAEFAEAVAWLRAHTVLTLAPTCAAACQQLRASFEPYPLWIFLAASRRGSFSQREVERLHRLAPLARLIALLGSWCEGETRSGTPLAGVARVAWQQWQPRAVAELGPATSSRPGYAGWSLPRTASNLDVSLLVRRERSSANRMEGPQLGVFAPTRERYLTLQDVLQACGFRSHWLRKFQTPLEPAVAGVIWDGGSLDDHSVAALQKCLAAAAGRSVLALLDFPRKAEVDLARSLGVAAMLSKPLLLGDLAGTLAHLWPYKRQTAAA